MTHFSKENIVFPFTAIIGQEEMKKALLLNVINPKIGGVLVFGEKGTGKSTAVRSIASLLPKIDVVKGCKFRCNPYDESTMCEECLEKVRNGEKLEVEKRRMKVVDLPVSATEDRVVGSLDIEEAIKNGKKKFELGILAEANRGILYVDEINLLDDHIVDLLLDSAAMGVNIVEREGVSYTHPANFILVGTMNPEEGELRPQLLDRFGFSVEIKGIRDPEKRVEIVKLRAEYDKDPQGFLNKYHEKEEKLCQQIIEAIELLPEVSISDEILLSNARIAISLEVDGHRGDLTLMKAAKANAALNSRKNVTREDVKEISKMVFLHRMRSLPFENARTLNMEKIYSILDEEV